MSLMMRILRSPLFVGAIALVLLITSALLAAETIRINTQPGPQGQQGPAGPTAMTCPPGFTVQPVVVGKGPSQVRLYACAG